MGLIMCKASFNSTIAETIQESSETHNHHRNTTLHHAIQSNDLDNLKHLIQCGADVNLKNRLGQTPLDFAITKKSSFDVFKILIEAGAYWNNGTVLHLAAARNDTKLIEYLLLKGADVNKSDALDRKPLHMAAIQNSRRSHLGAIQKLLRNGAKENAMDVHWKTPLHYAAGNADVEVARLLLTNYNVNETDAEDKTPLFDAVVNENVEVVQLLIDNGAKVNCQSRAGLTPLHAACGRGCGRRTIKTLLKNGAVVNIDYKKLDTVQAKRSLKILLEYCDFSVMHSIRIEFLNLNQNTYLWRIFIEHLAVLKALKIPVHPDVLESVSIWKPYNNHFQTCEKELENAKKSKLKNSWVTYFDLLVGSKRKLKNYAGNEELINDFRYGGCSERFPVYGASMVEKVMKGIVRRELHDKSSIALSACLPLFNPNHLIIRDVLDYGMSKEDLLKLRDDNSEQL